MDLRLLLTKMVHLMVMMDGITRLQQKNIQIRLLQLQLKKTLQLMLSIQLKLIHLHSLVQNYILQEQMHSRNQLKKHQVISLRLTQFLVRLLMTGITLVIIQKQVRKLTMIFMTYLVGVLTMVIHQHIQTQCMQMLKELDT